MTKTRSSESVSAGVPARVANRGEPEKLRGRLLAVTSALEKAEANLAKQIERHRHAEVLRTQEFSAEREHIRTVLHDGVGQVLTSLSFIATALQQKLAGRNAPEAADAQEIVDLANKAVAKSRALFGPVNRR